MLPFSFISYMNRHRHTAHGEVHKPWQWSLALALFLLALWLAVVCDEKLHKQPEQSLDVDQVHKSHSVRELRATCVKKTASLKVHERELQLWQTKTEGVYCSEKAASGWGQSYQLCPCEVFLPPNGNIDFVVWNLEGFLHLFRNLLESQEMRALGKMIARIENRTLVCWQMK